MAQARPFFEFMLSSKLFYAISPAWAGRLGVAGESRLLDLIGRLDLMVQNGYPVSDSLLWAVFLTAFFDPELKPREFKELREFIQERIKAALGGIEFPRPGRTRSPRCWPWRRGWRLSWQKASPSRLV